MMSVDENGSSSATFDAPSRAFVQSSFFVWQTDNQVKGCASSPLLSSIIHGIRALQRRRTFPQTYLEDPFMISLTAYFIDCLKTHPVFIHSLPFPFPVLVSCVSSEILPY